LPMFKAAVKALSAEAVGKYAVKFSWNDNHDLGISGTTTTIWESTRGFICAKYAPARSAWPDADSRPPFRTRVLFEKVSMQRRLRA